MARVHYADFRFTMVTYKRVNRMEIYLSVGEKWRVGRGGKGIVFSCCK